MRIHYKYIYNIHLLALLFAFTACSSEDDVMIEGTKTPIALSVGVEGPTSRAVITDEIGGKTYSAFGSATNIWMAMQSDYVYLGTSENPDELDYKGSDKTNKYCVTYGTTGEADGTVNPVNISGEQIRYWDDAHARSSALSIWALAVPGKTGAIGTRSAASTWSDSNPTKTIDWTIAVAQDGTSIVNNDLCFSNNIVDYTSASGTDRRMKYSTGTSKFDQGKLIFYHALTKITIKMVEGDGFNTTSTSDFNLDNITLKGFKLSGTFDVAQGEFSSTGDVTPITSMYQKEKTVSDMTLEALVMPGTDLNNALADAVSFSLDGNAFKVSSATLKSKLEKVISTTFDKFEAGKNYVFTFTINKTDIVVTATIADWQNLTAAEEAPLINVTNSYGQEGTDFAKGFSFLRSTTLGDGYAKDADITYADSKYTMTPQLYWPNHSTHYFFRGVWPLIKADGTPFEKVSSSAITVHNVAYSSATYPSDLMLGYPRTSAETCPHGNTVATSGICATEGEIRMNFQYVMSRVEVNLQTNEADGATNKVVFDANTKVEIVDAYTDGTILLSDGSATMGTKADYTMHRKGSSNVAYHDAIIPQNVTALKFRITVTDTDGHEDKYETVFPISEIEVKEGTNPAAKISAWEPGKHYVYNLIITKTGIKVTATIKDWITATGGTNIWM